MSSKLIVKFKKFSFKLNKIWAFNEPRPKKKKNSIKLLGLRLNKCCSSSRRNRIRKLIVSMGAFIRFLNIYDRFLKLQRHTQNKFEDENFQYVEPKQKS